MMTEVALAYIFDAQGRVLIAKRPQNKHMGGYWEFPGGKLDLGESPAQAIEREIFEELAICVTATNVLSRFALAVTPELAFFPVICQWLSGDIVLLEHDKYSFVAPEHLANSNFNSKLNSKLNSNLNLAPADVVAARKLINFLHSKPAK